MLSTCSPNLLTNLETCDRKGYWSRSWASTRMNSSDMTREAIRTALTATEGIWGEIAGSALLQIATDNILDSDTPRIYDSVLAHAALADLLVSSVRKSNDPAWLIPEPVQNWTSACLMSPDGNYLRRTVLVSHWSDERHYAECRSWYTLGEQAAYELPMQLVVFVIGQQRDGLRSSPWCQGFLHPENHQLRFRKRHKGQRQPGNIFNDRWERIHREDHAEISRETWLESMLRDDVLRDVLFRVDVPLPPRPHLLRVRDLASTKLERLYALKDKPEANLSSCDWPSPCQFRRLCHVLPEKEPEEKYGFIRLSELDRRNGQPSTCA